MSMVYSGNSITFPDGTVQNTVSLPGMRNRIINGAMMIDQRNAGASAALVTAAYYLDRWSLGADISTGTTVQQSTSSPSGFAKSLLVTVGTGATPTASNFGRARQFIEGLNAYDLKWGTADAQSVTVSFWVKSSLTGTFGACVADATSTMFYTVAYTISSVNTWEYKSFVVPGPTSGTWPTDNTASVVLAFDLGEGPNRSLSATGAWQTLSALGRFGLTGGVKVLATSGATWAVTGVQLEKGSTATSFDYRPYGTELALCQRYYYKLLNDSSSVLGGGFGSGVCNTTTTLRTIVPFPVPMRTAPSAIETTGVAGDYRIYITASVVCTATPQYSYGSTTNAQQQFTVASGLTAGQAGLGGSSSTSSNCYLAWSAEL